MKKIGLVTGGGAGPELALVFSEAIDRLAAALRIEVEVVPCPYIAKSFTEMKPWGREEFESGAHADIAGITHFYEEFHAQGGRCVFRTAVNAESLYFIRRRLRAIKLSEIDWSGSKLALIRDEEQGFYASDQWTVAGDCIRFSGGFHRQAFERILSRARSECAAHLGPEFGIWFVYKHHLFANAIEDWVHALDPAAEIFQPGMAWMRLLSLREQPARSLLIIAGNEIGDFLHEVLISASGSAVREMSCARNIYQHPSVDGLVEYQTIHGSADDLRGLGKVNPVATLRAAAAILTREFGCAGVASALEATISEAVATGLIGPGIGISLPTMETASALLDKTLDRVRLR